MLRDGDTRNVVDAYRYWTREAIVADIDTRRHPLHVAIENFGQDANIGGVVRAANAFAVDTVHIVGRRRWNRRGAMVTDRYQRLRHHDDTADLLSFAAGAGLTVVAVDIVPGAARLEQTALPRDCLLLFGQEGPGISDDARAGAALTVSIAQFGSTRSINVAVAAGIAMHTWISQHGDIGERLVVASIPLIHWCDIEFDGQRGGSRQRGQRFPRGRPGSPGVWHVLCHHRQGFGEFEPGKVGAQAVMHAGAEGLHRVGAIAGDIELVGFVVDGGIPVGRGGVGDDQCAGRDHDSGEFDILEGDAQGAPGDRGVPHRFLDRVGGQLGVLGQQCPLVGVIAEHLHRGGELVSSGVGAGNQQAHDQHAQLVGVEPIAIVFGADQLGDQVVGQRVAAVGDHIVDVVVDGLPCRQDGLRLDRRRSS